MKVQTRYTSNYTSIAANNQQNQTKQTKKQSNPSFGSGLATFASMLETGGFLTEFLCVDFLGMAGPRTVQGYGRNYDKTGKINYQAGTEELIRELLSGPAYFFVPLGIIAGAAKLNGKCARVDNSVMDAFEPMMKKANTGSNNAAAIKGNFIDSFMKEAFGDYKDTSLIFKKKKNDAPRTIGSAKNNIEKIIQDVASGKQKPKAVFKEAEECLTALNKVNGKNLDNTNLVELLKEAVEDGKGNKIIKGKTFPIKSLVYDIPNYLDDFTKKAKKETTIGDKFIEAFHKTKKNIRNASTILAVAALCAFLTIIPRLYQVDKSHNPAHNGLDIKNYKGKKESEKAGGGVNENK